MKKSSGAFLWMFLITSGLLLGGVIVLVHAWKISRVSTLTDEIQNSLKPVEILNLVDLQIEHTIQRLKDLDPGPPPPWYYPSYYYEWLPKARLFAEMQETLHSLRKQRHEIVERGKIQIEKGKTVWNFGIAPILHILLAVTLILTALRCILRFALWNGKFSWISIEES
jgi:hypothetical protein